MKRTAILLLVITLSLPLFAQGSSEYDVVVSHIVDIPTVQYFTSDEVEAEDMNTILMAGINAPSGMNSQPWHFTAVTDKSILEGIESDMLSAMPEGVTLPDKAGIADAPLAIIISAVEGSQYDAGLATENMAIAAALLGYGTKIVASPAMVLNGDKAEEYREILHIPQDQIFVAALLVGTPDTTVDSTSSATTRNPFDSVVSII